MGNITSALALSTAILMLSGCVTYAPQSYSVAEDNVAAVKGLGASRVGVGAFTGPADFDSNCRAAGSIQSPGGLGFADYIRRALIDELRVAGAMDDRNPAVTLTGTVEQLAFSSSHGGGQNAFWDIRLRVGSSNGRSVTVSERYDFQSGFIADSACKRTADAYMPAVQRLIGRLVRTPEFRSLVTP